MSFAKFGIIRERMPVCTEVSSEKLSQGTCLPFAHYFYYFRVLQILLLVIHPADIS